jgi:hypothetical protein
VGKKEDNLLNGRGTNQAGDWAVADSPGRRKPQTKAAGDYCDKKRENVGIGPGLPVEIEGILGNEKWNGNGKKTNQRMPGEENDLKYGIKVGVGHREGGGGKWTAIVNICRNM